MTYEGPWSDKYIETQYNLWKDDPQNVDQEWHYFFQGFELAMKKEDRLPAQDDADMVRKQSRVEALIYRYRDLGHLLACLDPLEACPTDHPLLNIKAFGLDPEDLALSFYAPGLTNTPMMTLKDILVHLKQTYCHSIGVEYMHLQDPQEREWFQLRMESSVNGAELPSEERIRILHKLCQAKRFEHFTNTKYLGQKRFSLEGSEVLIPMIDRLFNQACNLGVREIVMGMSHRGRLNVQVNILNKLYDDIFREFENQYNPEGIIGTGDVKYHKGFQGIFTARHGEKMNVIMANNPSHLESVNPVVEGIARARQDMSGRDTIFDILPILLHGDAAFSGQGIVPETLNLSQLDGYRTGGTVHIIVNNQIGYTTLPEDARSTRYSTDNAKSAMVPIFHVHGEDPEALMKVVDLAVDYRSTFNKDVVIDVVCYRLYGHNEGDEPYFTQPDMYTRIRKRQSLDQLYAQKLVDENLIQPDEVAQINSDIESCLDMAHKEAKTLVSSDNEEKTAGKPSPARSQTDMDMVLDRETLVMLSEKINHIPDGFHINPKLKKMFENRAAAVTTGSGIDWGNGEALAFASILHRGVPIRLSGEDSQRGTFSHRHSVVFDTETNSRYVPLAHLGEGQGTFSPINSPLSEAGVLGFEYGYSITRPKCLTIWEAQFGDFVNNAQVVIDQYLVSGETKWQSRSGLVLLLPHGYEGMGPEHSSARLERFLQLCAEDNLHVVNPTTPAQFFHLIRRQILGNILKPLVVMTPKSLLRHPLAISGISDFTDKPFQPVLEDTLPGKSAKKVVFCSGKLYYDLLAARTEEKIKNVRLVRVEQYYPFPGAEIRAILNTYKSCRNIVWAQEEPENQGAWLYMADNFKREVDVALTYVGRKAQASPATGYLYQFKSEQRAIVNAVME